MRLAGSSIFDFWSRTPRKPHRGMRHDIAMPVFFSPAHSSAPSLSPGKSPFPCIFLELSGPRSTPDAAFVGLSRSILRFPVNEVNGAPTFFLPQKPRGRCKKSRPSRGRDFLMLGSRGFAPSNLSLAENFRWTFYRLGGYVISQWERNLAIEVLPRARQRTLPFLLQRFVFCCRVVRKFISIFLSSGGKRWCRIN